MGRLIGKRENEENKQTQEYSKKIQPINNDNNVNIYNNVPGTTTIEKKQMKHRHQIQNQNRKYQIQFQMV